ncbi:unnamed protein product [Nesidiocoris tenuis]|uniref:C2H2-type domain-containing protein n=1 Tax=Nesidiocoris tenuis TaxID=355587 RepID=A0A6H5GT50_9HEMI|nr:unnamed protein product [Nesidiocoris tenuis]
MVVSSSSKPWGLTYFTETRNSLLWRISGHNKAPYGVAARGQAPLFMKAVVYSPLNRSRVPWMSSGNRKISNITPSAVPIMEKPHKCSLCSKSFPTPGDLKSHMYVHNGSWPFRCNICSRGFSKHTNLKNHLFLHTGKPPKSAQGSKNQSKEEGRGGGAESEPICPRAQLMSLSLCPARCIETINVQKVYPPKKPFVSLMNVWQFLYSAEPGRLAATPIFNLKNSFKIYLKRGVVATRPKYLLGDINRNPVVNVEELSVENIEHLGTDNQTLFGHQRLEQISSSAGKGARWTLMRPARGGVRASSCFDSEDAHGACGCWFLGRTLVSEAGRSWHWHPRNNHLVPPRAANDERKTDKPVSRDHRNGSTRNRPPSRLRNSPVVPLTAGSLSRIVRSSANQKCDRDGWTRPATAQTGGRIVIHIYSESLPEQVSVCSSMVIYNQWCVDNTKYSHISKRDKPHSCDLCHKKFALACNLRAHMKTHEAPPPTPSPTPRRRAHIHSDQGPMNIRLFYVPRVAPFPRWQKNAALSRWEGTWNERGPIFLSLQDSERKCRFHSLKIVHRPREPVLYMKRSRWKEGSFFDKIA